MAAIKPIKVSPFLDASINRSEINSKLQDLKRIHPSIKVIDVDPSKFGYISDDKYYALFYSKKPVKKEIQKFVDAEFGRNPNWKKSTVQMGTPEPINRFFIALRQLGQVDKKGRMAVAIGYSGKMIAEDDRAFCSVLFPLIAEASKFIRYSNDDAAEKDLAEFKEMVADLRID